MNKIIPGREAKEFEHQLARAEEYLDERGREIPSGVPMAPPIGYKKQPSLHEQIREMIRSEKLRMEAESAGYESFDEADDFSLDPDDEPQTHYQNEAVFEGDVIPPPEPSPPPRGRQAAQEPAEGDDEPSTPAEGESRAEGRSAPLTPRRRS